MSSSALLAAACAALAPAASPGTRIPVANASFESPAIAAGTFQTTSAPPGWSLFGSGIDFGARTLGVLDPSTTSLYPGGAPHGENVGVVFLLDDFADQAHFAGIEAGLRQTLAATLATDTRYVLRVEVGNIANDPAPPHGSFQFAGFPGYRVELVAGGSVLASDSSLLPPEGEFRTAVVSVAIGSSHPNAGQPLAIRLVNLNAAPGLEANFDRVRLRATPRTRERHP